MTFVAYLSDMETLTISFDKNQFDDCVDSAIKLAENLKEVNIKVISMLSSFQTNLSVSGNKSSQKLADLDHAKSSLQEFLSGPGK